MTVWVFTKRVFDYVLYNIQFNRVRDQKLMIFLHKYPVPNEYKQIFAKDRSNWTYQKALGITIFEFVCVYNSKIFFT